MIKLLPVFLTSLVLPTDAEALSCLDGNYHFIPGDGASDLPINSLPLVWYAYSTPTTDGLKIQRADTEEELELTITNITGDVYSVVPNAGFETEVTYQWIEQYDGSDPWVFSTFTIGTDTDEEGPAVPVVSDISRDQGESEWGGWDYLVLGIDDPNDDTAYYQVEIADNPEFTESSTATGVLWNGAFRVGSGECGGNYPQGRVQDIQYLRITAYDISGNFSESTDFIEWNDDEDDPENEEKETGCNALPASTMTLWGLVSILGLGYRRR